MGFVPPLQITILHFFQNKLVASKTGCLTLLTCWYSLQTPPYCFHRILLLGRKKIMKLLSPCTPLPCFFQNTNNNNDITTCFVIYPIIDYSLGLFLTWYQCLYPPYVNSTASHPMLIGGSGHTSSCL